MEQILLNKSTVVGINEYIRFASELETWPIDLIWNIIVQAHVTAIKLKDMVLYKGVFFEVLSITRDIKDKTVKELYIRRVGSKLDIFGKKVWELKIV